MSILEVHDVSIRYMTGDFKDIGLKEYLTRRIRHNYHINEFWADKNISFSLEKGDMLGIIGANGAGKSTLLKAISGIMAPTKGWVKRDGNIAALLELASGFDGDLTVRENAYLRGAMLGYTRKFMDETYDQIIDFAELRDFQDRPFKQLSSGMKSRLAFAIASLVHPDILILDEVLSVGDGAFQSKSAAKMREIIQGGATTILVSHSLGQVREMCNKVLWLHRGEQIAFGDNVEEICDQYQVFLEGKAESIVKSSYQQTKEAREDQTLKAGKIAQPEEDTQTLVNRIRKLFRLDVSFSKEEEHMDIPSKYRFGLSSPRSPFSAAESKSRLSAELRKLKKPVLFLSTVYLLAFSSILRANFNYIDDMARVAMGYSGWNRESRFLSVYLAKLLHGDSYLADVSPLPQIVAILLLALSGAAVIRAVGGDKPASPWTLAAVLPLGLSPYFLECVSYKYDSPYMALSILISVAPLLLAERGGWRYRAAAALGSLAMCTSYQASSGVFPMLAVLLAFRWWNRGGDWRKSVRFLAESALCYGAGVLVFQAALLPLNTSYIDVGLPPIRRMPAVFLGHLKTYYSLVRSDFKKEWLLLALLLALLFLYTAVRGSARRAVPALAGAAAALAAMLALAFGLYPFLTTPIIAPRAMFGFGVLLALLGVSVAQAERCPTPAKLVPLALSWLFFTFSLSYGNALYIQREYTDFRVTGVIQELNRLEAFNSESEKTVQIFGSIGLSPVLRNQPQDYQMLNRLVPVTFRGPGWYHGTVGFDKYYGLKNVRTIYRTAEMDLSTLDLPVLSDTMYFTIRGDGERFMIQLK